MKYKATSIDFLLGKTIAYIDIVSEQDEEDGWRIHFTDGSCAYLGVSVVCSMPSLTTYKQIQL